MTETVPGKEKLLESALGASFSENSLFYSGDEQL
jgi:hypothetical protein